MNYGSKLKDLRFEKQVTQEDVAKALQISRSTYKDYEIESTTIPIKHLINLSSYFDVSIDYILDLNTVKNYSNSKNEVNLIEAGNRLKEFRKENKLTQVKLASILNTTFSTIAFYEKGRNLISTSFLYIICKKYNISADYLLNKTNDPKYLS